jgi:predicted histidine transporter YuiF (NhaC family)
MPKIFLLVIWITLPLCSLSKKNDYSQNVRSRSKKSLHKLKQIKKKRLLRFADLVSTIFLVSSKMVSVKSRMVSKSMMMKGLKSLLIFLLIRVIFGDISDDF